MEKDILNETIESLHKVIEAKDKIINAQVLEIARLKKINSEIKEVDDILLERIDKAKEYIKENCITAKGYDEYEKTDYIVIPTKFNNLLAILGDKEND